MMRAAAWEVLQGAIRHIAREQQPDGSFVSLSSADPGDFRSAIPYSTTFFASLILGSLNAVSLRDVRLHATRDRAAQFLFSQKGSHWSWNYWHRGSKEYTAMPYPDDTDDTFAALTALAGYDRQLIGGKAFASIAKLLTSLEIGEGGPYRTWLVGKDASAEWHDVDIVANSTIGSFLSLFGVRLPKVQHYIERAAHKKHLSSPYYPGPLHIAYFVSRFSAGTHNKNLPAFVARHINGHGEAINPLERALLITTLIELGLFTRKRTLLVSQVAALLKAVGHEGWKPYALCIDPARAYTIHYAGASALTAALCAEALTRYQAALDSQGTATAHSPRHLHVTNMQTQHDRAREGAERDCRALPQDLKNIAIAQIRKTRDARITIPTYAFHALLSSRGIAIPEAVLRNIAAANLYGWMAYTIYDDLLDGEGDPLFLSCANFFLRKLTHIYTALENQIPGVWALFNATMNDADAANTWEQRHCRISIKRGGVSAKLPAFGNYRRLADRSFGHVLGPLVQLHCAGYAPGSKEHAVVASFFHHYLIARQLHDDAHDWADDLSRGRVNAVGALVLRGFHKAFPRTSCTNPLQTLIPRLRVYFWKKSIRSVVEIIHAHINAAREKRNASLILKNIDFMEGELAALEDGADRALAERAVALEFLKNY